MARRKLTPEEQLKGVEAALRSKRTPPWLKKSMRRFAEKLRKEIAKEDRAARQNPRHSYF